MPAAVYSFINKNTYLQVIYMYESSATIFVILGKTHY